MAIPRYGEPVRPGIRYGLRPGVYAILPRNGQILLTRSDEVQLPGGGVDPGEQPLAALRREVLEETGWTIDLPRRIGAFRRFVWMPDYARWAEKLCCIYVARPVRQRAAPTEPGHAPLWLCAGAALERLAVEGDRRLLARWLRGG